MRFPTLVTGLALVLCLLTAALPAAAQTGGPDGQAGSAWSFQTRAIMTGTSEGSDPEGYKLYSAIAFETGLRKTLARKLALELTASLQSREVELTVGGSKVNLGSVEVLPINLFLQWRPRAGGKVRPYVGAGPNVMIYWEKSGSLDSTDLTPSLGMALQAGIDVEISPAMFFNVDFKANSAQSDLKSGSRKLATLRIHPATLGFGLGFRF